MKTHNIHNSTSRFKVLQTGKHSQTAIMTLQPGGQSSEELNVHKKSDQVLLVIEGTVQAELAGEKKTLQKGETCIVPAGTKHRFLNPGDTPALTFNVYSPPEYPADEKD